MSVANFARALIPARFARGPQRTIAPIGPA
jgi:hypothetical protein